MPEDPRSIEKKVAERRARKEMKKVSPDTAAALRRLDALEGIPTLEINDAAVTLARRLIDGGAVPPTALDDALHVAVSAAHGIEYLPAWNYRHIDNAETKPLMRDICESMGCVCPEICTPQELMGVSEDG